MKHLHAGHHYRRPPSLELVSHSKLASCFAKLSKELHAVPVYLVEGVAHFYTTFGRGQNTYERECIGWFDRFATFEELSEAAEHTAREIIRSREKAA